MKTLLVFIIALMLFGCGQRNSQDVAAKDDKAATDEKGFTVEERAFIEQISDLDCRLFTLYGKTFGDPESPELAEEIKGLRNEKRALIEKIMEINNDSLHLNAVREELRNLRDKEEYCPELRKLDAREGKSDKNGVPVKSLQIGEDAGKLARMNCRIMNAHLKLEETPGDREAQKQLDQLLMNKRTFINQLILMYGNDILRDEGFRTTVMDIQDQECQYRTALKKHNRMTPFIP
jgi:hypothetical protein